MEGPTGIKLSEIRERETLYDSMCMWNLKTKANEQTEKLDNSSKDINRILDNLKPTLMNKNNMVISSEDVQEIKNFTKDVKDTNKTIRSVNDLNLAIKDFEYSAYEVEKENRSLKYQLEQKEETINRLTDTINDKDEIIDNLRADKEELKGQLHKFKEFWKRKVNKKHKSYFEHIFSWKKLVK